MAHNQAASWQVLSQRLSRTRRPRVPASLPVKSFSDRKIKCPHQCLSVGHLTACCHEVGIVKANKIVAEKYRTVDSDDGHVQALGQTLQMMAKAVHRDQFSTTFPANKRFPAPPFSGLETIARDIIPANPNFKNVGIVFNPHFAVPGGGSFRIYVDILGGLGEIVIDENGNTVRLNVREYVRLAANSIEVNNRSNHTVGATYPGLNFEGNRLSDSEGRMRFTDAKYVEFIVHAHVTPGVNYIDPPMGNHDYVVTHS